jgi:hypothetical protein
MFLSDFSSLEACKGASLMPLFSSCKVVSNLEDLDGIKEAPLHASKLEKSLKNMEGIAKMTGNKNGLMTKVVKDEDFLTNPKLSNMKEADKLTVKVEKTAVKAEKS